MWSTVTSTVPTTCPSSRRAMHTSHSIEPRASASRSRRRWRSGSPLFTVYSGTLEFMDEANSWLVEFGSCDRSRLRSIPRRRRVGGPRLRCRGPREVVDDPHLAAERGARAASDIAWLHGPAARVPFIIDRLEAITGIRRKAQTGDGGRPWSAVDSAAHYLSAGPDSDSPSKYGFVSRTMRRFVMRFVRHFAEHQDRVQYSLVDSVRDMQDRLASESSVVRELEAKVRELEDRLNPSEMPVADLRGPAPSGPTAAPSAHRGVRPAATRLGWSTWPGSTTPAGTDQQEPWANPDDVLEGLSDDLLEFGDLSQALRRMLQRGFNLEGQRITGLQSLAERLRNLRRDATRRYDMDSIVEGIEDDLRRIGISNAAR